MNKARYSADTIAKYVITEGYQSGRPVSNLAVQKILFFVQRDYLRAYGTPLFREDFEAWPFGPMIRSLYFTYCIHGARPIAREYDTDILIDDTRFIDPLIDIYRADNPWELVKETHREGSAWTRVWENGNGKRRVIPLDMIKVYG